MESEVNILPTLNNISKMNMNNINLFLRNIKDNKKLLNTYNTFVTKYFEIINSYYKQLTELNCHFLVEEKFKESYIKSPMFQLGKSIKNIVDHQVNNLFSIITDDNIFNGFNNALSNLSKIIKESSEKFDKKRISQEANNIAIPLFKTYENIELKIIDKYIFEKYNKHVIKINNDSIEKNIEDAKSLENSFLEFKEKTKKQFYEDLKEMESKIENLYNDMKNTIGRIIKSLKVIWSLFLETLEKELKSIQEIGIQNNENFNELKNFQESKPQKRLELKNFVDLDIFKYKIKILSEQRIIIEEDNNKKGKEKKEKKEKTEGTIFKENDLLLNEEDIYKIVSSLYSYNFQLIDKLEYNLDKEKVKIELIKLSEKLLSSNTDNNIKEPITEEEVNKLYELVKNEKYLKKFFTILNNYRTTGKCNLTETVFKIIKNIFNICQDYLLNKKDKSLEGLIIILSQTFYILKNEKKVYLQEELKEHPLYKKEEFWKDHLKEIINDEINKIENDEKERGLIYSKEIKEKKIRELIMAKIITFSTYMLEFGFSKEMTINLINPVIDEHKLDENSKIIILSIFEENSQ